MVTSVWILAEEIETGTMADGEVYCLLSAHATKESAERAEEEWRESHDAAGGPHKFEGRHHGWCRDCGHGVWIQELEVEL